MKTSDPETGREVLKAFLAEKSPLGPLRVMAKRVGRFFQVPLPGFKPYIVFGPEAVRKVLITERDKFLWRNHDPVTDLLDRGVLVTDGAEHDHYRKLMEPSLHPAELPRYAEMMLRQTDRVTAAWKDGDTVDMLIEGRKIALLIVMDALFGVDAWDDLPKIWTPILKAIDYISPGAWILWRHIPRPGYKKHLTILDAYIYKIITARRAGHLSAFPHQNPLPASVSSFQKSAGPSFSPLQKSAAPSVSPPQNPLPASVSPLHKSADPSVSLPQNPLPASVSPFQKSAGPSVDLLQHLIDAGLSDSLIRDQMLTMLIAGHDTSTALLAWTFALLGQHPEIFARLAAELQAAPEGEHPHLLDEVIKESLRLYPPIHIGNRIMAEDVTFGERETIPAGARMFYSIYLTHRDPQIWQDADKFCPERFAHGRKTPPMSYIPFGGGPRACIGAAFGQAEARLVITRLLKTFDFQPLNAEKIYPHMGATLEPRPGVLMRVTRRQPSSTTT